MDEVKEETPVKTLTFAGQELEIDTSARDQVVRFSIKGNEDDLKRFLIAIYQVDIRKQLHDSGDEMQYTPDETESEIAIFSEKAKFFIEDNIDHILNKNREKVYTPAAFQELRVKAKQKEDGFRS